MEQEIAARIPILSLGFHFQCEDLTDYCTGNHKHNITNSDQWEDNKWNNINQIVLEEVKMSSVVIQLSERTVFGEEFHVTNKDLEK